MREKMIIQIENNEEFVSYIKGYTLMFNGEDITNKLTGVILKND